MSGKRHELSVGYPPSSEAKMNFLPYGLRRSDRMFWVVLAGLWKGWRRALVQVEALLRSTRGRRRLAEEIADVLVFSLLLCHEAGLDPAQVVRGKLRQNAKKYPVRLAKGRALKYTELHWGGRSSSRKRRSRRRNQALRGSPDRKSTRLNSSHLGISYAVF